MIIHIHVILSLLLFRLFTLTVIKTYKPMLGSDRFALETCILLSSQFALNFSTLTFSAEAWELVWRISYSCRLASTGSVKHYHNHRTHSQWPLPTRLMDSIEVNPGQCSLSLWKVVMLCSELLSLVEVDFLCPHGHKSLAMLVWFDSPFLGIQPDCQVMRLSQACQENQVTGGHCSVFLVVSAGLRFLLLCFLPA